jgi:multidrug efflux pump subunit AcrA (membrane-fusion protein)
MRNFALIFLTVFFLGWICTPIQAVQQAPYDEVEAMLKKVEANLQTAGQATKLAQTMSAELVAAKVEEKAELKEAVAVAQAQTLKAQAKVEKYAVTMMFLGVDTAMADMDTISINNMLRLNGIK